MAEAVVVGVRVRPFNDREKGLKATLCISMNGSTTSIKDAEGENRDFAFDESFWSHDGFKDDGNGYMEKEAGSQYADQRYVFDTFGKRVLDNAWSGFHCCLFAYGQTGAGKSYSMVGYGANKGIVPISCEEIFKRIDEEKDPNRRYEVTVSMVEIYNETVQDLLINLDERPKKGLEIRESKLLGIYIDGVIKRPVKKYASIEATIDEATSNRTVGCTLMNATSSRAHTVQTIEFKQVEKTGSSEQTKISMVNLVDLAGSEKAGQTGATGDRLKEGAMINKSLSALGNVIEKLAEKSSSKGGKAVVIPYRDSKLTRLLQNALGGSSKTIMICALSPASSNYDETLSTLRYADRAKKIKNTAVINENPQDRLLRELKQENAKLKEMMANMQSGDGMNAQALSAISAKQKELEEAQKAFDEMSKTFEQRQQEDMERQKKSKTLVGKTLHRNTEPLLANLNADPLLTGRTKYYLPENKVTRIGSHRKKNKNSADAADSEDSDSDEEDEGEEEQELDILLIHDSVWYHHADISNVSNQCYLKATQQSAESTFVNGKSVAILRIEKQQPELEESDADKGILLQHGDRVVFGECYFFFADPESPVAPEIMLASGEVSYTKAQVEVLGLDPAKAQWTQTNNRIISMTKKMKVFRPLVKILIDVKKEHQQLEERRATNARLSQALPEIKSRSSVLESQLKDEHQELETLKKQVLELEALKTEKEELKKKFEEENAAKIKLEEQIANLQPKLNTAKLEDELKELQAGKDTLVQKLQAELSEAKMQVQEVQEAKTKLEEESLQSGAPKSKQDTELNEAQEVKMNLDKELKELRAEKDALAAETSSLMSKVEAMVERCGAVSKLQSDLAQIRSEKAGFHEQVQREREATTKLDAEKSQHEVARLQQELESTRQELEGSKQKLHQAAKKPEEAPKVAPTGNRLQVSFEQAMEAIDVIQRTLSELEVKTDVPDAAVK